MIYHANIQDDSQYDFGSEPRWPSGRPQRPAAQRAMTEIERIAREEAAADQMDSQYLDARKLRRALGGNGQGGEAHHIIPGNRVRDMKLEEISGYVKDDFNDAWNGILLHGTGSVRRLKEGGPAIVHRNNVPQHNRYDGKVQSYINRNRSKDLRTIAAEIEDKIRNSGAECLDDMSL